MADCIEYTTIPELPSDFCNSNRIDTRCIFSGDSFSLLDLEANTSLDLILNALIVAMNAQKTRIDVQDTIIADLESRIIVLESYHP